MSAVLGAKARQHERSSQRIGRRRQQTRPGPIAPSITLRKLARNHPLELGQWHACHHTIAGSREISQTRDDALDEVLPPASPVVG